MYSLIFALLPFASTFAIALLHRPTNHNQDPNPCAC